MMVVEYGNDMIVIDMGFQFPEEDMLGVDYVLPDFTYVQKNKHKLRGVLITHGHLDHIGAIPYISPKLDNPNFYGTKLTMGLVTKRLEEFGLVGSSK
ncbi:ribonuclease J, partial [Candidatus Peregrinibacteria bacterium CG_4_10_14_0_2_um_filter_41_8]